MLSVGEHGVGVGVGVGVGEVVAVGVDAAGVVVAGTEVAGADVVNGIEVGAWLVVAVGGADVDTEVDADTGPIEGVRDGAATTTVGDDGDVGRLGADVGAGAAIVRPSF